MIVFERLLPYASEQQRAPITNRHCRLLPSDSRGDEVGASSGTRARTTAGLAVAGGIVALEPEPFR